MNPWDDLGGSGYQLIQSLYAVSLGGIIRVGFGQHIQKVSQVSEAHADFIFSICCGGSSLVACYLKEAAHNPLPYVNQQAGSEDLIAC